ncbi:MAG TPA: type II secretion system protein GspK, partial [Oligoflexia bacterium]|nr:type II secretion system protein GspK [Oligoflexia bacterium]
DSNSHSSANFPGQGIESSADKAWFYNRVFRTISELALVPGMTPERMSRIAPFVRTSQPQSSKVNINTAPLEVLLAIGIPESQAREIFAERTNLPIDSAMLQNITAGDAQLARVAAVTSQEF